MINISENLSFNTQGKGMYEITTDVTKWIKINNLKTGQINLFIQHTSASLTIMENASPDVIKDINSFFLKLVPEDSSLYKHRQEGDDDMPAHIKNMLTQSSITFPMQKGKILLGAWQGIFLYEHRYHPSERNVIISYLGS